MRSNGNPSSDAPPHSEKSPVFRNHKRSTSGKNHLQLSLLNSFFFLSLLSLTLKRYRRCLFIDNVFHFVHLRYAASYVVMMLSMAFPTRTPLVLSNLVSFGHITKPYRRWAMLCFQLKLAFLIFQYYWRVSSTCLLLSLLFVRGGLIPGIFCIRSFPWGLFPDLSRNRIYPCYRHTARLKT
ncbi:uncharacterized protein HD556DRAFT_680615 [Suillus plorans]|uniref:Uncharacterized protein n=1 Tax=Suillus plorans TaxID=116603 RepID=A0A9P7AJI7_9AGAM|nr:uncharacterized protein HD556DRAFT_680615 [Suillus plorans]KAG1790824.1 hypothetical protein HD556DRAFT_680615 [Suillus plorans]